MAALALEDYEPYSVEASSWVEERQAVELTVTPMPRQLPPHLVARLSMTTRRQLGIPGQTVVEVRRRLRPMVVSQLNRRAIPVAGIYLAGVAVESLRGWPLAVGLAIAVLFGLAPLRRATATWPVAVTAATSSATRSARR